MGLIFFLMIIVKAYSHKRLAARYGRELNLGNFPSVELFGFYCDKVKRADRRLKNVVNYSYAIILILIVVSIVAHNLGS